MVERRIFHCSGRFMQCLVLLKAKCSGCSPARGASQNANKGEGGGTHVVTHVVTLIFNPGVLNRKKNKKSHIRA
jgi:hypothetical protein